jgi:hypothetical protein
MPNDHSFLSPEGISLERRTYPGYGAAVNELVKLILLTDREASWIVTGGDDVEPDPNRRPDEIARQCSQHFRGTFGVMQPTGDRWGEDRNQPNYSGRGAYIDRVCGSPWLGRDFCRRMYGGHGPLFHGYRHMFVDEELQAVAQRLGVLWQRRDLTHFHRHWARVEIRVACPSFLAEANSPLHWQESQSLFRSRAATGFPGHKPLPPEAEAA